MDTGNPKPERAGNALPFFSKYGHYIVTTMIVSVLVNLLLRSWRKREQFKLPPSATNPELACMDMRPDEEFDSLKDSDEISDDKSYQSRDLQHAKFEYTRPSEAEMLRRSLEFYEIVNARRSLRFFSSDPVSRDVICNIIKAAGTSPSGAHTEPWTFAVVSNAKLKKNIRDVVEREERINYLNRMGKQWVTDLRKLRTNWCKSYLTEAPYLILVFKQEYGILPSEKRKINYYKEMSVAIACGILITAIQYAGLVTVTSTPMNCGSAMRAMLNRPLNEKLVLMLPVGYPAETATVPDLKRKELEEILVEYV